MPAKIEDVGHLKEQTTKINNLRPEIQVFHGYTFERSSNTVVEAWLPDHCDHCGCAIRVNSFFIRTQSLSDEDLRRHGLRKFEGRKPVRGLRIHTSSPFFCEPCRDKWLEGGALEEMDEKATERDMLEIY